MKPTIGITMGDAAGVGPEVIIKALNNRSIYDACNPLVIGDCKILQKTLNITGSRLKLNQIKKVNEAKFHHGFIDFIDLNLLPEDLEFGKVNPVAGDAAYQYIEEAAKLARNKEIQGICTAPLNKESLHQGGHMYAGHTEILAALTETKNFAMMLSTPELKVIHLTTHVGLKKAIDSITPERTYEVIRLANDTLIQAGIHSPKVGVCGINPHAGENGLFGEGEEESKLQPGIEKAVSEGINVSGPLPADTIYHKAIQGDFDIIIACYHDQGHIPIKVLGMEEGVNITVGLKGGLIRTSVDHGTAFDIAGKNLAKEDSMVFALKQAAQMAPSV